MDLRKIIPTEDTGSFLNRFCNVDGALVIHERCFILRCDDVPTDRTRRPYIDIEMSLKYIGVRSDTQVIIDL